MTTIYGTKNLLLKVMEYSNENVIKRISIDNNCSLIDAYNIFQDTKRFLYLCGTKSGGFAPSQNIDSGWHAFILHTKDYLDFCTTYFGKFIHHNPNGENYSKEKGLAQIERTLEIAFSAFGELSSNWNYSKIKTLELNTVVLSECNSTGCSSNDCVGTTDCQS